MVHVCNSNAFIAEASRTWVLYSPGLYIYILSFNNVKKKRKEKKIVSGENVAREWRI